MHCEWLGRRSPQHNEHALTVGSVQLGLAILRCGRRALRIMTWGEMLVGQSNAFQVDSQLPTEKRGAVLTGLMPCATQQQLFVMVSSYHCPECDTSAALRRALYVTK